MKHGILSRVLLAAALLLASFFATADVPVPPLKARVTDLTATLSPDQVRTLEQQLAALEARKGSQVAVLMVRSVQPEAIEQYTIRVFDQWKLGRKGVDDGVLLVIAKNDRKLRIEVGRGLEGAIPDAYAKRIIDDEIVPLFKQGNFADGIEAGVARIAKLIDGEPMPAPQRQAQSLNPDLLIYGFIAVVFLGGLLRAIFGRFLGSGIAGIAAGVAGYILLGAIAAAAVTLVVFLLSLLSEAFTGRGSGWSSGGYSGGGSSWSSGGGGGFSGGGFSGGGGDSGGGGASGSW